MRGSNCCRSRPNYDDEMEEIDGFHQQFKADYDPKHNAIYNDRRVNSQPSGQTTMSEVPQKKRSLGGDAPFSSRPKPEQLPSRSSRATTPNAQHQTHSSSNSNSGRATTPSAQQQTHSHTSRAITPQPQLNLPPASLQPGGHRRGESNPPKSPFQPIGSGGRVVSDVGSLPPTRPPQTGRS